jgi:selenocysteine lyase/cysteine desulfurase
VASAAEHNSVLRPLWHLKERGVETTYVPVGADGLFDPEDIGRAIRPDTKLVALNHVSNVTGLIQPIAEVGAICEEKGVPLLVDASQSAGVLDVSMRRMGISLLAWTGHKSMLGPTGIGGLIVMDGVEVSQTRFGGTGFDSASRLHPPEYPWRLEVGSVNLSGVAGISAALDYLEERTVAAIRSHEMDLYDELKCGLEDAPGLTLYHPGPREGKIAVLSVNFAGIHPDEAGRRLLDEHSIMVRSGLHCAPLMHEALGTYPDGTVRFSIGALNTSGDIRRAVEACRALAG